MLLVPGILVASSSIFRTPVPLGAGEKSGGNLAPAAIDKKSTEKENLSEDPSHGHS